MTAGHCAVDETTGQTLDPSGYQVITGAVDLTDTANRQLNAVSEVVPYPSFNPGTLAWDAALLVLSKPTSAKAVRLGGGADQYLERAGTPVEIAGWGNTYNAETDFENILQWASTGVQRPGYCEANSASNYPYYSSIQLCAVDYPYDDDGTCSGDSGGPLLATDASGQPVEIGITSTVPSDCGTDSADFFTAVLPISAWAGSWIKAVAPATSPPASAPQLPTLTVSDGRNYVRQTVAGVLSGPGTQLGERVCCWGW
jgi:secreted trypsin-like serine protease